MLMDIDYNYGNNHKILNMSPCFLWFAFNYAKQSYVHERSTKVFTLFFVLGTGHYNSSKWSCSIEDEGIQ
jgi:hypothetical protein